MPRHDDPPEVKEALQGRDIADLKKSIDTLTTTMAEGFKGVHERQDTTNGKVIKANDDITNLKAEFKYNRIIWYMFTIAISIIIALGSYILFRR